MCAPTVVGKFEDSTSDEWGTAAFQAPGSDWLLRPKADLTPAMIARAIAKRLTKLGVPKRCAGAHAASAWPCWMPCEREQAQAGCAGAQRTPWFCSGYPHNASTRVPEGCRAVAGIGCHYMTTWMPDRSTSTFTQMGGEGVTWVGQAPFTKEAPCLRQPGRRHLLPQRAAGHPPEHCGGGEHHLQDACTTTPWP